MKICGSKRGELKLYFFFRNHPDLPLILVVSSTHVIKSLYKSTINDKTQEYCCTTNLSLSTAHINTTQQQYIVRVGNLSIYYPFIILALLSLPSLPV